VLLIGTEELSALGGLAATEHCSAASLGIVCKPRARRTAPAPSLGRGARRLGRSGEADRAPRQPATLSGTESARKGGPLLPIRTQEIGASVGLAATGAVPRQPSPSSEGSETAQGTPPTPGLSRQAGRLERSGDGGTVPWQASRLAAAPEAAQRTADVACRGQELSAFGGLARRPAPQRQLAGAGGSSRPLAEA
jgi:hypothetical protein